MPCASGLSYVRVSRTFSDIREQRLVEIRDCVLTIHDLDALMAASFFNPNYLHLGREGAHLDANDVVEGSLSAPGRPAARRRDAPAPGICGPLPVARNGGA